MPKKFSLSFRLILLLSLVSLLLWISAALIAWNKAKQVTDQIFDQQQILFAQRLSSTHLRDLLNQQRRLYTPRKHQRSNQLKQNDNLAFAIFTPSGELLLSDGESGDNIRFFPRQGFSRQKIDHQEWRVFWLSPKNTNIIIAVAQETQFRIKTVTKIVFSQLWIWLAGFPILLGLIWLVIRHELRSLKQLQQQLITRDPQDHQLITIPHLPSELTPVIDSLNQFIQRTATTLIREKRFTADAAHELRSPLTAMRIQTEVAQMASIKGGDTKNAYHKVLQAIDRMIQLVEQLLLLSQLDSKEQLATLQSVDWQQLSKSVMQDLDAQAEQKNIQIHYIKQAEHQPIQGDPLLLQILLRNLIHNAIQYCPPGSVIEIIQTSDQLIVQDNGEGISNEELQRLGERFYRPAGQNEKGCGLGISIVKRIAALHHYELTICANVPTGLRCIIQF